jgi:choline dehydrogenase
VTAPSSGTFFNIIISLYGSLSLELVGELTLRTANPFDQPNINPNLLGSDFDVLAMSEAVAAARDFVKARAWDDYVVREFEDLAAATDDAKIKAYLQANSGTIFHPIGTASMSPKGARFGVVDPDLVVKGVSGVRIVDGSILVGRFPFREFLWLNSDSAHRPLCSYSGPGIYCWGKSRRPYQGHLQIELTMNKA